MRHTIKILSTWYHIGYILVTLCHVMIIFCNKNLRIFIKSGFFYLHFEHLPCIVVFKMPNIMLSYNKHIQNPLNSHKYMETSKGKILKLQRIGKIEEYIKEHGSVSLDDLCKHFSVSKNTIRRDINELEARQIVRKVYGGVVLNDEESPIPLSQRQMTMKTEKTIIAEKAAKFVNDGDVIIIDAGSTTVHMVDYLRNKHNITIITNSVPVLNATFAYDQIHVIATGGDLLRSTNSLVGSEAISTLKKFNANTVFLAATSISLAKGITNSSIFESELKRTMIGVSERVVLLVDHTKFDAVSLVTFAELQDIDVLVTDEAPSSKYFQYCQEHDVEVVVANQ